MEYLKLYFTAEVQGQFQTNLAHPWVEEIQFFQIRSHALLQGEIIANL